MVEILRMRFAAASAFIAFWFYSESFLLRPHRCTRVVIVITMRIYILRLSMWTDVSSDFITHGIIKFCLTIRARCCNFQTPQEPNTEHGRAFVLHAQFFYGVIENLLLSLMPKAPAFSAEEMELLAPYDEKALLWRQPQC